MSLNISIRWSIVLDDPQTGYGNPLHSQTWQSWKPPRRGGFLRSTCVCVLCMCVGCGVDPCTPFFWTFVPDDSKTGYKDLLHSRTWHFRKPPHTHVLVPHLIENLYGPLLRRRDSKWSSECKKESSMVNTDLFSQGSFEKRRQLWPSRISICFSTTISSLIFAGTDCTRWSSRRENVYSKCECTPLSRTASSCRPFLKVESSCELFLKDSQDASSCTSFFTFWIQKRVNVESIQKRVTGWPRLIGCLKLQVIFRKRATDYAALLQKMTYEDKASYDSMPPFTKIHSTALSETFPFTRSCTPFFWNIRTRWVKTWHLNDKQST